MCEKLISLKQRSLQFLLYFCTVNAATIANSLRLWFSAP